MFGRVAFAAVGVVIAGFAAAAVLAGPGTPGPDGTAVPAAVATDVPATATQEPAAAPTEVPETDATGQGGEGGEREIAGIPDDNPNFVPDEDGQCETGETVVKTTPSGNQVNVPCHAAQLSDHAQQGHPGDEHGPDGGRPD